MPSNTVGTYKKITFTCSEDKKSLDLAAKSVSSTTVDVIVENWSRNNYGKLSTDFKQVRGLTSNQIEIDGNAVSDFTIYPLQFKGKWVRG